MIRKKHCKTVKLGGIVKKNNNNNNNEAHRRLLLALEDFLRAGGSAEDVIEAMDKYFKMKRYRRAE